MLKNGLVVYRWLVNTCRCIGVFIEAHVYVHTFVASLEGGLHVARDFLRQRSASEERMFCQPTRCVVSGMKAAHCSIGRFSRSRRCA